jgi:hypothetical protein
VADLKLKIGKTRQDKMMLHVKDSMIAIKKRYKVMSSSLTEGNGIIFIFTLTVPIFSLIYFLVINRTARRRRTQKENIIGLPNFRRSIIQSLILPGSGHYSLQEEIKEKLLWLVFLFSFYYPLYMPLPLVAYQTYCGGSWR